ncbi:hypothetical protein LPC63_004666, partial [Salmonella enterica]|nr:hypothetical protein [Salmonella enterica]
WKSSDGIWLKQEIAPSAIVKGISHDGNVVYGSKIDKEGNYRGFYLSRSDNEKFNLEQSLGTFYKKKNGSYIGNSEIYASSQNGDILIGKASSFEGVKPMVDEKLTPDEHAFYAFRKADGTYEKLSEIAGFNSFRGERNSVAKDITTDGDMIIGSSTLEGNTNT